MALTKAKKNEKVKMLASELESSTSAIIGTFKGLTASKDFELRKVIRGAGGSYIPAIDPNQVAIPLFVFR